MLRQAFLALVAAFGGGTNVDHVSVYTIMSVVCFCEPLLCTRRTRAQITVAKSALKLKFEGDVVCGQHNIKFCFQGRIHHRITICALKHWWKGGRRCSLKEMREARSREYMQPSRLHAEVQRNDTIFPSLETSQA